MTSASGEEAVDAGAVITRSGVRRLLDDVLLSDADLDAFVLDHFPEVHKRWAGGMNRVQKVNLLLISQFPSDYANYTG